MTDGAVTAPDGAAGNGAPARETRLPIGFARRHGVLITGSENGRLRVLYRLPVSVEALAEVRRFAGAPLALRKVANADFEAALTELYERDSGETFQMAATLGEDLDLRSVVEQMPEPEDLLGANDDAPIIRLLNALFTQALRDDASDIHIEPFENRLVVRFRIDGVLREVLEPRRELAPFIVSRIKVMARLDIAEKRLPQDGRISLKLGNRSIDVRVATIPSGPGERVVLRLLDKQTGRMGLEALGMDRSTYDRLERLIARPHGVLLVTGPTGSGKSTTLYGILNRLNDRSRSILTVEDPIEYYIDGVGQTQVNAKINMNFARGLRAILRQDPDVVMVGEIRDLETAQIAVQASLTGHLVLSTLHTNTAVGAVTRLRDMGVEPFLLSSTLIGVLAQRLVRLLCADCKRAAPVTEAGQRALGVELPDGASVFHPIGCEQCNHTGYRGRTGIFELVTVDDALQRLIHDQAGEHELEALARRSAPSIRGDGLRRVLSGETALEEVLRVTSE